MPPKDDTRSVELKYADAAAFEAACQREDLRSLVVWNCKVRDFSPLARLKELRSLTVMNFRGSLDLLSGLTALRSLELVRVADLRSLKPLAPLTQLRSLSIEPRGGNPLTDRTARVDSLKHLEQLTRLEELSLMRIDVAKGGLKPLAKMPRLRTFECSNIFPVAEVAALAGLKPKLRGSCMEPTLEMPLPCGRCGTNKVRLNGTGIGRVRLVCPVCQKDRVAEHTALWDRFVAAARRAA